MRLRVVATWLLAVIGASGALLAFPETKPAPPSVDSRAPRPHVAPLGPQVPEATSTALSSLPLRFEPNAGQADTRALFVSRSPHGTLFLTSSGAVLSLPVEGGEGQKAVGISFAGASPTARVTGEDELPGRTHYLKGKPSEWQRDVAGYARVRHEELYRGIDVVFYGRDREFEFDVVVAPGADPGQVAFDIAGADRAFLDDAGDCVLEIGAAPVRLKRPVAYQDVGGIRRPVDAAFELAGSRVTFRLGAYDASEPLVIDPVITFATYLGGNWDDEVRGIGTDAAGNVYVAGRTMSSDFPVEAALDDRLSGPRGSWFDAFVAKLTPSGSSLIYSTYLGGAASDEAFGLAVDSAGHAYVVGKMSSPDFPLTAGAFSTTLIGASDAFLTKLTPDGSAILYSTAFGTTGTDMAIDVHAADDGRVYLLGHTNGPGFPLTADAYWRDGTGGSFLSRFNTLAAGPASLEYSTFTGIFSGNPFDLQMDVASDGDVVLSGGLLLVPPLNGFQTSRTIDPRFGFPSGDAAVLRVDTRAADPAEAVVYASYIGGARNETGLGVGAGPDGLVCLVGNSESADFPSRHAFQPTVAGFTDAFVAVFDTSRQGDGSLIYSTLLGGFLSDEARHCRFTAAGAVRVIGQTRSSDFPLRAPFQAVSGGSADVFVAEIDPRFDGALSLVNSSYYGGSGEEEPWAFHIDRSGALWVGGVTRSADLPVVNPIQAALRFRDDGFLVKLEDEPGGPGGGDDPPFVLSAVAPVTGGAGLVTIVVHGAGLANGTSLELRRDGVVIPSGPVTLLSDAALRAPFDLSQAALGAWDVVARHPDGRETALGGAFTVEPRTLMLRASASVVMSPIQRFGRPATGYITYSNPTNVDVMLPIFIYFPRGTTLELGIPVRHGQTVPTATQIDFSLIPRVFDNGTEQVMPLIVNVPPGHTGVIPLTIPEGCDPANLRTIRVVTGSPAPPIDGMACAVAMANMVFGALPLADCVGSAATLLTNAVGHFTGAPATLSSWIADILWAMIDCFVVVNPGATVFAAVLNVTEIVMFADDTAQALEACTSTMSPAGVGSAATDRSCVTSVDPNAKYGPSGAGDARYLSGADPMTYIVAFENLAAATAAAQDVIITDVLDASRLDLDTFTLGPITFGSRTIVPPAGLSTYVTTVDLRPHVNLLLRIDAGLDRSTGVASWRFASLDPATGAPTTDPVAGFLPPNVNPPDGEGTVMFTVAPNPLLVTGDVIRNSASIVFDVNAPIDTGEWTNAVDKTAPVSAVAPLTSPHWSSSIVVQWAGSDAGAGVADYSVFVSENGGPFVAWLTNTTGTSAVYEGAFGSTYAFFSLARDRVGHVEPAKSAGEAIVEVRLDTEPPVLTLPAAIHVSATGPAGAVVTFEATAVDEVDGVRPVVCTPVSGTAFPIGVTTVTCTAFDTRGNSSTGTFPVTVNDAPTPGKMIGAGRLEAQGGPAYQFAFEVRALEDGTHSGRLQLDVCTPSSDPAGSCRQETFMSEVLAFVRFSDDATAPSSVKWNRAFPNVVLMAGQGAWNGDSGYSFEMLAIDRGEPGPGRDVVEITIRSPAGETVAVTTRLPLVYGNLQSAPGR